MKNNINSKEMLLYNAFGHNIKAILKGDIVFEGFVDMFESRIDSDDGFASIRIKNKTNAHIFSEPYIKSIEILD